MKITTLGDIMTLIAGAICIISSFQGDHDGLLRTGVGLILIRLVARP